MGNFTKKMNKKNKVFNVVANAKNVSDGSLFDVVIKSTTNEKEIVNVKGLTSKQLYALVNNTYLKYDKRSIDESMTNLYLDMIRVGGVSCWCNGTSKIITNIKKVA